MSQSFLPNGLANSWQDKAEQALTALRTPTALAVIASVGVHVVAAVLLPMMSSQSRPDEAQKSVQVVELSPSEQSRLPNVEGLPSPLAPSVNSVPSQPKLTNPFAFPPSGQTPAPPLNPPPVDSSSMYTIPPLMPPPTITFSTPVFQPPLPSQSRITIQPEKPAVKPTPQPQQTEPPREEEAAARPAAPEQPEATKPEPEQPPVRSEKIPAAAIAQLRQKQAEYRAKQEQFAYNPDGTSEQAFAANATALGTEAQTLAKENLNDDWKFMKVIKSEYLEAACPVKIKAKAQIGGVVTPDGKLAAEPKVLQSSGYKAFDQLALDYVKKQEFDGSEQYTAIIFPFEFAPTPELCPPGAGEPPTQPDESPTSDQPAS